MLKATLLAAALTFALAAPVHAANNDVRKAGVAPVQTALPDDVVEVQSPHRNPAGTIAGDAIGGAVLGAAVGGGVALYNRYVPTNGNWNNWERDVAIGAGIGLGVGLIFGAVDAASAADRAPTGPLSDERVTGFGNMTPVYGSRW